MKSFGYSIRDSAIARFTTAMLVSLLVTSATFSPLLMQSVASSPLPQELAQPQALPLPQPGPQTHSQPPSTEYPDPEPCHGVCNNILDPSIFYEEGMYWRFSTSDNISVATAPSLEGPWKFQGSLLPQGTSIFVRPDQHVWVSSL
jgi:arabinan endo-1,5-alpha-L-arabinosidase